MPTRTKTQPTADTGHAITNTPYDAVKRRAQAERDKLAQRLATMDAEIAAAEDATVQEREAEADRDRALTDLATLRDQQAARYRQIEDLTAQLTVLCGEAVTVDKTIANAERRATGRTARQWAAQRLAAFIRWQLAPTLPDVGQVHPGLRRRLVDQPREATTATMSA